MLILDVLTLVTYLVYTANKEVILRVRLAKDNSDYSKDLKDELKSNFSANIKDKAVFSPMYRNGLTVWWSAGRLPSAPLFFRFPNP